MYFFKYKKCKLFIFCITFVLQFLIHNIKFILSPYIFQYIYNENEDYLKMCNDSRFIDLQKSRVSNNPKISIISPVYNTGKFVLRLLISIQYQNFKDLEIILIDDCSKDNSVKLIKEYQKKDKRIKLIQNNKNKGTFSSRNLGILKSKGHFIMIPDPDDILLENTLNYFYHFSMKYNYEVVRYNIYLNYGKTFFGEITNNLKSRPIYQPRLSTYLFYGQGFLRQIDFNICNKFIKREALIRSLNFIKKKDINMYMTCHEDGLLNYILYRKAKSLYFVKKFGYYYIRNNYNNKREYYTFNNIKFSFIHLIYVFKYSKNTRHEKAMTNDIFKRLIVEKKIKRKLSLINKEYNFFINIINTLNKNAFFSNNYKKYLKYFKDYFKKQTIKII